MRSERGKRKTNEKEPLGEYKIIFYFILFYFYYYYLQSSYGGLLLIIAYCNSVLNFLRFSMFDVSGFLSFELLKMLKNSI